ncbi:MAG: hypothetical protein NC517_02695 [Firmicutes bacterium]|nr:hypothetical protein [Bacillota bacterium]
MQPTDDNILKKDGLSLKMLEKLSYHSNLNINLKKNLHYFDKEMLFEELKRINKWYDASEYLCNLTIDYRIKSLQSAFLKYERYYPDHQAAKVFNDMLGFRTLCDSYMNILLLKNCKHMRIADMSEGKAQDDGYRGVHVYFQLDNFHYPIEIQYNTYYDRQMNNWLHKYLYKKSHDNSIGQYLRQAYENAEIRTENEFRRKLRDVLSDCEKI